MVTENLSTLKINKLTQAQYERELAAGRIDENALYLTPDEEDYLPLSGGTVTGNTTFKKDVTIGDIQIDVDSNNITTQGRGVPLEINCGTNSDEYIVLGEGGVKSLGSIYLDYETGLHGRRTSSDSWRHFAGYDSSGNLVFGTDSYTTSVGDVYYQGKTVNIRSKSGITIEGTALDDHVVEQSISDTGWSYRKWNSGIAECWRTSSVSLAPSVVWGSLYYVAGTKYNFPSGLFNSKPRMVVNAFEDTGAVWVTNTFPSATDTGVPYIISPGKHTSNVSIDLVYHAIGRWK